MNRGRHLTCPADYPATRDALIGAISPTRVLAALRALGAEPKPTTPTKAVAR